MSQQYSKLIYEILNDLGVKNPEELIKDDLYLGYLQDVKPFYKMPGSIEVECKVISITLLDNKCQTSLVKQGYPLR